MFERRHLKQGLGPLAKLVITEIKFWKLQQIVNAIIYVKYKNFCHLHSSQVVDAQKCKFRQVAISRNLQKIKKTKKVPWFHRNGLKRFVVPFLG
jgi:hypothetical protein